MPILNITQILILQLSSKENLWINIIFFNNLYSYQLFINLSITNLFSFDDILLLKILLSFLHLIFF